MPTSIHILLGGLFGPDGLLPGMNTGMYGLRDMLAKLPGVTTSIYTWDRWQDCEKALIYSPNGIKRVVIGYSGGGSRATYIRHAEIDLLIGYDPSPANQVQQIRGNVHRALCYYNEAPWMFGLGGGRYFGINNIAITTIRQWHMAVQYNQGLHAITEMAVRALL
jgi:hypothetical protein